MTKHSWLQNTWTLVIATLILPIVGLFLLWYQKNRRLAFRIIGTFLVIGFGLVHFVATIVLLVSLGIMEPSGGMNSLYFRMANTESHYNQLEQNRSQQEALINAVTESAITSTYWTDFRGPQRDGTFQQEGIALDISSNKPTQLWKQPIGGGYASFVIANGIAYTIEQRRQQETAVAYDLLTGKELWAHTWDALFEEAMGGPGPRATPTWHDGKLYVLGATGEFYCLNAQSGDPVWNMNILSDNHINNITWGMSSAPLIVDDLVIVVPGGNNDNTIIAYDKQTGEKRWSTLSDGVEYVSPMLVTLLGKQQILQITKNRVVGLEPTDGSLLWSYNWDTQHGIKIAQPLIINDQQIFLSTGYGYGCDLIELSDTDTGIQVEHLWHNRFMKNKLSSSILHDGHIYGLDEGVLSCLNAATGERVWKKGRYGHGQLLLANNTLIILSEQGALSLVNASPDQYEELYTLSALSGKTWNIPAISDGFLLIRNASEMACYKL